MKRSLPTVALLLFTAFLHAQDPGKPLDFTGSITMEVRSYRNGAEEKDSPAIMRMAYSPWWMAMSTTTSKTKGKEEMRMVFDLKNRHTYTLITDEKGKRTGIKMKTQKINVDDVLGESDTKVERTDETRPILGHTCRKYTYSDKEGHGEVWIAENVKFDSMAAFRQMIGGKKAEAWQKVPYQGVMLENTWHSANGKQKSVMTATELTIDKVDEGLFSTAGYEIQDMTAFPVFGQ
jgi:hypothetical protein